MSIKVDISNETPQGSLDRTQGLVAACYRNAVDTKLLQPLKLNSKRNRRPNRKDEKKHTESNFDYTFIIY